VRSRTCANSNRRRAMQRSFVVGLAVLLAGVTGCGGSPLAPVSGVVKLNGKPYKNAVVSFQPLGSREAPNPGRGSSAVTDEKGRFELIHDGEKPGAVVGRHRIRIITRVGAEPGPDDGAEAPKKVLTQRNAEPIPAEWHERSTKEFEVHAGGTTEANFDIVTRTAAKK